MNVIKLYFLFIVLLHVLVPVMTLNFLGVSLRAESNLHDLTALYPQLAFTICCFALGMLVGGRRYHFGSYTFSNPPHTQVRLYQNVFLIQALAFLLVSSFLRYTWGIHSYLGHLLMHANFGVLIFLLMNINKNYFWPVAFLYLPFLLLNGSKGDPVWWSLIVIITYAKNTGQIEIKTILKSIIPLLILVFLMFQLIRFQQFNRGDVALSVQEILVLTFGARMYGLEGYLLYLEAPRLYNIFYSQLSEILQFLPNADQRPGVTFGIHYYYADQVRSPGISAFYSSMFVMAHYLGGYFGVFILGFTAERMLRFCWRQQTVLAACCFFVFVQSVSVVNGALSWVALNIIATYLVLKCLVILNQNMGEYLKRTPVRDNR